MLKREQLWHFNMYEREKSILGLSEPKKDKFLENLILTSFKGFMVNSVESIITSGPRLDFF